MLHLKVRNLVPQKDTWLKSVKANGLCGRTLIIALPSDVTSPAAKDGVVIVVVVTLVA